MMRIGTPCDGRINKNACSWDDVETELLGFCISYSDTKLYTLQFFYSDNGNTVLSKSVRGGCIIQSPKFKKVLLDYPSEYLTKVSGFYEECTTFNWTRIVSITFGTNKGTYGPYGRVDFQDPTKSAGTPDKIVDFNWDFGPDNVFAGFFGKYSNDDVDGIGVYIKPSKCGKNPKIE